MSCVVSVSLAEPISWTLVVEFERLASAVVGWLLSWVSDSFSTDVGVSEVVIVEVVFSAVDAVVVDVVSGVCVCDCACVCACA